MMMFLSSDDDFPFFGVCRHFPVRKNAFQENGSTDSRPELKNGVKLPSGIKDQCNVIVPMQKCRFYLLMSCTSSAEI